MKLEQQIQQWRLLKKSKARIEARLAELRTEIIQNLVPGKPRYGLDAKLRDLTTYKEDDVYNIMHHRGINGTEFTKSIIDPDKIEQLYYQDRITDDDLRCMRDPKYTIALTEVDEEENV